MKPEEKAPNPAEPVASDAALGSGSAGSATPPAGAMARPRKPYAPPAIDHVGSIAAVTLGTHQKGHIVIGGGC
jgi:hypothetical protein